MICNRCHKSFAKENQLKDHMLSHEQADELKSYEEIEVENQELLGAAGHCCAEKSTDALTALIDERDELKEALQNLFLQQRGLRESWCGMWFKCVRCTNHYARGGNWSVGKDDGICPYCVAEELLK